MVWPCPSKRPLKTGMESKAVPERERSLSRTTCFPSDQVSREQFFASSRRSCAVRM